jgi:tripartite-type tricarboxylate transporter receptor subunit TctC
MRFVAALLLALLGAYAPFAMSQAYPSKPIRLIISFPPGGGIDVTARTLAQKLGEQVGQPVVVDNRAGGNTVISAEIAAHAPPDGYTLFMPLEFTMTQNGALYEKLPYDPVRDFVPISRVSRTNLLFVTHAKSPFRNLQELVAYGKANPGKLNFAASAVLTRLMGEQLKSAAGVDMVFVPYKGTAPMLQALLGGEIDLVIDGTSAYVPSIRAGKLRPLAGGGPVRHPQLPDNPTAGEQGFPQAEASGWLGVFAPAGTPQPIVTRLNTEIVKALQSDEVKQKLEGIGVTVVTSTPAELGALVKEEIAKWSPVIRAAGIKAD